ncbi:MAG: NUMOD3 domain-containing DNA-binding protein [Elusimicrobia bacterium]|nr:NUMOD3 domain-containing DNA-binding protein [Elusimicrobiota bacterium]
MKHTGIYEITNLVTGKVYIGSAVNFVKRKRCHISTLQSGTHRNDKLQKSFNKHGIDCFEFKLIVICSEKDLLMYEQLIIDYKNSVKNGYNILPTAGNWYGRKHSEETKAKMKAAWDARRLKPKKPVTEETKKKISQSKIGKKRKPFTEEAKKNMSISRIGNKNRLGIPHTNETKEKMRATRMLKKESKNVCS